MQYRIKKDILLIILSLGCVSCLRETTLPMKVNFSYELEEQNQTSPVTVILKNLSVGTDFYEWTFENGIPEKSNKKNPETIKFITPGEHRIKLRAWNAIEKSEKEITIRVDSAVTIHFEADVLINDYAPVDVEIMNKTKGGVSYEWQFKGGIPAVSTDIHPGVIRFEEEGVHEIRLKVFNGSKYFETSKTITLQPRMNADFSYTPSIVDRDMEAPLTLMLTNLSKNALAYQWVCDGADISNSNAALTTEIRFHNPGVYIITLIADNKKEKQVIKKQIAIKENSGLFTFSNLKFGISEAKNTIGCFFSSKFQQIVTSDKITSFEIGSAIDIGFFALNSSFSY